MKEAVKARQACGRGSAHVPRFWRQRSVWRNTLDVQLGSRHLEIDDQPVFVSSRLHVAAKAQLDAIAQERAAESLFRWWGVYCGTVFLLPPKCDPVV